MKRIHRSLITLVEKEYLTPNFLRATFYCNDIEPYLKTPLGVNNKLFFPPEGVTFTEENLFFSEAENRWIIKGSEETPIIRTYTHRKIDPEKRLITIDFAVHEGDTIACDWIVKAEKGAILGMAMKIEHRPAVTDAKEYLFMADMTGIPVASALIEALPASANVTVLAEILSEEDKYPHFTGAATINVEWVINPDPSKGSPLLERLKSLENLDQFGDGRYAHVTTEYSTVRSVRTFLRDERLWERDEVFACAYWQIGKRENEPRQKRMED